jgi:hypothetical protein
MSGWGTNPPSASNVFTRLIGRDLKKAPSKKEQAKTSLWVAFFSGSRHGSSVENHFHRLAVCSTFARRRCLTADVRSQIDTLS